MDSLLTQLASLGIQVSVAFVGLRIGALLVEWLKTLQR